jgi:hypothetical protein
VGPPRQPGTPQPTPSAAAAVVVRVGRQQQEVGDQVRVPSVGYYRSNVANEGLETIQGPILRVLNLQLQRQRCSRQDHFFKIEESIFVLKTH